MEGALATERKDTLPLFDESSTSITLERAFALCRRVPTCVTFVWKHKPSGTNRTLHWYAAWKDRGEWHRVYIGSDERLREVLLAHREVWMALAERGVFLPGDARRFLYDAEAWIRHRAPGLRLAPHKRGGARKTTKRTT